MAKKIAKLASLTIERGATAAEAENARAKADALRQKQPPRHKYAPPPLPETVDEWLARRKGRKATARQSNDARPEPRPRLPTQPSEALDEVTRLRAEVARLTRELAEARAKAAKPATAGKPGRKPIGDRAMTAAERMRRMRQRMRT